MLVTVTSHILPDLEELLCFLLSRKLTRIHLNNFRPIGRGKGHPEWRADQHAFREAIQRAWARSFPDRPVPIETPDNGSDSHCRVGKNMSILPNGDVFACHVLTQPEFRCGNVREQSLTEILSTHGLLGELASIDFRNLVNQEGRVGSLLQGKACMGEVYSNTRDLPVWRKNMKILPLTPK